MIDRCCLSSFRLRSEVVVKKKRNAILFSQLQEYKRLLEILGKPDEPDEKKGGKGKKQEEEEEEEFDDDEMSSAEIRRIRKKHNIDQITEIYTEDEKFFLKLFSGEYIEGRS